jgi:hypothetical protein
MVGNSFLVTKYGSGSFRQAHRNLQSMDDRDGILKNKEAFRKIYCHYPAELEAE